MKTDLPETSIQLERRSPSPAVSGSAAECEADYWRIKTLYYEHGRTEDLVAMLQAFDRWGKALRGQKPPNGGDMPHLPAH